MTMKITLLTGRTFDIQEQLGFEIKVIRSAQAKRLTLRIDEKARIPVLTIPPRCLTRKAVDFVNAHRDWITNMLARIPVSRSFADGDVISIMGKKYTVSHQPRRRGGAFIEQKQLIVCGAKEFMHRRVTDFLKKTAHDRLLELSRQKAALIDRVVHSVSIKDTKSRWGSCSSKSNINYNWRIVLAPAHVIDYLVCHEVSHLRHQDHSPAFWDCVASLCPDYQEGRAWLKVKGKELYRYT